MLTALQERIRRIVGALPAEVDLALAGGGGLVVAGVIDRRTRDLDFFARYPSPHAEVVDSGFRAWRLGRVLAGFANRDPAGYADFPVDYQRLRATTAAAAAEIARLHPPPDPPDINV